MNEPTRNASAARQVSTRWRRQAFAQPM
jgi:hypothetical protein